MSLVAPFLPPRRPAHAGPGRRSRRARGAAHSRDVLLIGAGGHAAALRTVLTGLPEATDLVVVLRTATREDLVLGAELAELTLRRGGRLIELTGARSAVALDATRLRALVGDVAGRDVYVSGPPSFAEGAIGAARLAGVPECRLHLPTVVH